VLCHNDLQPAICWQRPETGACGSRGVLDFEGALAGDPYDVAKALYYLQSVHARVLEDMVPWIENVGLRRSIFSSVFVLELGAGWPG